MPLVPQHRLQPPAVPPRPSPDPLGDWVARHTRGTWRFARLLGCDSHLADDLVQDALLAALHKEVHARDDAAAAAWLRAAVRNLWRAHLRARRRHPTVAFELAELVFAGHAGADGSGDAFVDALRRCVARLRGRARTALELRYTEAAPRAVIAQRLGLSSDGVKTLLRRTRDTLLACVQRVQRGREEA